MQSITSLCPFRERRLHLLLEEARRCCEQKPLGTWSTVYRRAQKSKPLQMQVYTLSRLNKPVADFWHNFVEMSSWNIPWSTPYSHGLQVALYFDVIESQQQLAIHPDKQSMRFGVRRKINMSGRSEFFVGSPAIEITNSCSIVPEPKRASLNVQEDISSIKIKSEQLGGMFSCHNLRTPCQQKAPFQWNSIAPNCLRKELAMYGIITDAVERCASACISYWHLKACRLPCAAIVNPAGKWVLSTTCVISRTVFPQLYIGLVWKVEERWYCTIFILLCISTNIWSNNVLMYLQNHCYPTPAGCECARSCEAVWAIWTATGKF